jgi:hypothetical protein
MKIERFMVRQIAGLLVLLLTIPFAPIIANAQQPQQPAPSAQDATAPQAPTPQTGNTQTDAGSQNQTTKPIGTAVAPYEKTTGATASRPAGAVIAPARQRRMRSILIKVGVIAAAGVAIGTVAALSHGSPSQPH